MPSQAQTFAVLKGVQSFVQTNFLVGGASPFSPFNAADATKYGVTNAIYCGVPKDITAAYPRQCWIVPVADKPVRHAVGGKVWDEQHLFINVLYNNVRDWYQTFQDLCAARDAFTAVLLQHAQLPGLPIVAASKLDHASAPNGYQFESAIGADWQCWGFTWWLRQEYNVGPIVS